MSELKSNVAIGVSGVALAAVGVSHYKLNARINSLEETLECLQQDLVDLAQLTKTMKRSHEDQIMQTSNGLRDLSSKVRKLEKISKNKSVDKELSTLRHEIDNIVKSMSEGTSIVHVAEQSKKQKPKKKEAPKKKKQPDESDDDDFQAYLDTLSK